MSHSVIFHSDDLQARAESRWDIPLAYSQGEMDAWYPGGHGVKAKVLHLQGIMDEEIESAEKLVAKVAEWPNDLDKAESWAANVASHLARAYVIARGIEKHAVGDIVGIAIMRQQKINRLHDESEWRIAEIEGAAL